MSRNALQDFIVHAEAFTGLYEPLYLIKEGAMKQCQGVWADWEIRIHHLNNAEALIEFWDTEFSDFSGWNNQIYSKKAQALLRFLSKGSIIRNSEKEVEVSKDTYQYYATEDGNLIEPGTTVVVKQPFWSLGGNVLEKGIIFAKGKTPNVK